MDRCYTDVFETQKKMMRKLLNSYRVLRVRIGPPQGNTDRKLSQIVECFNIYRGSSNSVENGTKENFKSPLYEYTILYSLLIA